MSIIIKKQTLNFDSKSEAVARVASECGRSESTIWEWKKKFNWDERESVRAAEVNRKTEERLNEQLADFKAQYLKLLNDLIFEVLEKRQSGSGEALGVNLNFCNIFLKIL